MIIFHIKLVNIQSTIPQAVGSKNETKVHFMLFVSFFIVRSVVVQGKCKSVKIITFNAVRIVQPLFLNISPILYILSIFTKELEDI